MRPSLRQDEDEVLRRKRLAGHGHDQRQDPAQGRAQVAVNQHMLEKDSPVDFMLDPGNYIVDITMSAYAPIHKVIIVDKGGKAVIDEVLQHE